MKEFSDIKVLIVEDEEAIREMLSFTLHRAGFEVIEAADAREGEKQLEQKPDLVLLDWMLPGISGVEFARRMRNNSATQEIPIIMLTARGEEENKLKGFEVGVDDYMTKPFSTQELLARIKAVLRRVVRKDIQPDLINVNGLELDVAGHRVRVGEKSLDMGPTEFRLLSFFMSHAERVFSRDQLLDRVWGDNIYIEDRTVDVHIRRLRKVLEPFGYDAHIQTVRGAGYRFSKQT
jgi:two-component system phosphate regulon response regulator PhoB